MVQTPVGYRCPECAGGSRTGVAVVPATLLLRALGLGLLVATAAGVTWGYYPEWGFYLALVLGFGTVEVMAWAVRYRRGGDLLAAAIGCILIGLLVSRYTLAFVTPGLSLDLLLNNFDNELVRRAFYLRPIPDFLFMALPFGIAWIRFR
jgi:hypothetical protein